MCVVSTTVAKCTNKANHNMLMDDVSTVLSHRGSEIGALVTYITNMSEHVTFVVRDHEEKVRKIKMAETLTHGRLEAYTVNKIRLLDHTFAK